MAKNFKDSFQNTTDIVKKHSKTIASNVVAFTDESKKQIKKSFTPFKTLIFFATFIISTLVAWILNLYIDAPMAMIFLMLSTFVGSLALFLLAMKKSLGLFLEGISLILLGINYAYFTPAPEFLFGFFYIVSGGFLLFTYYWARKKFYIQYHEPKSKLYLDRSQWIKILLAWLLITTTASVIHSSVTGVLSNGLNVIILFFTYSKVMAILFIILTFILRGKDLFVFIVIANLSSLFAWGLTALEASYQMVNGSFLTIDNSNLQLVFNYALLLVTIFASQTLISFAGIHNWWVNRTQLVERNLEDR